MEATDARQHGPANASYWDAVYAETARAGIKSFSHAWQGLNWTVLRKATRQNLQPQDRILVLGAGDSGLPKEIFDAGCRNVTAIDFSAVLVAAMSEQSHGVLWRVEDASQLSFQESNFDTVLDVGLLDSVGAGEEEKMSAVISEALRVLSPGGTYISTSTDPPLYRLPLFAQYLGANATKVLFVPRHRDIDRRVRRIDPALDMGKLSIYVSVKPGTLTPETTQGAPSEVPDEQDMHVLADAPAEVSDVSDSNADDLTGTVSENVNGLQEVSAEDPEVRDTLADVVQDAPSNVPDTHDTSTDGLQG